MSVATVAISREVIENLIFGMSEHPISILACWRNGDVISFKIAGEDVPESGNGDVRALLHVQMNRAGDKLRTMTFEAISPPKLKLVAIRGEQ